MKKSIAAICVFACILTSLAGCGKQAAAPTEEIQAPTEAITETTAPRISEDTELIMELMENYLNREQPRHETAQYRFGLRTTANKVPVYQYDDLSFTPNGEVEYWNSNNVYTMAYGNVYTINIEEEQQNIDLAVNGYEHPEIVQRHWASENHCGYYFTTDKGVNVEANTSYGALSQRGSETQYVFSALDQNSFEEYMTEKLSTPETAEAFFSLGEEEIHYMDELQNWMLNERRKALENPEEAGEQTIWARNGFTGLGEKPQKHSCYAVTYDISSEYQNENSTAMIRELFDNRRVFGMSPDGNYGDMIPAETRLDDGLLHVTLYFDKDTRQCVAEKIDATDCAGPMIDYLISRGNVEETDRTFVIERQYSADTDFEKLPDQMMVGGRQMQIDFALQDRDTFRNKIVVGHEEYDVAKVEKYTVDYDQRVGVYKIMDGKKVAAVAAPYYGYTFNAVDLLNSGVDLEPMGDYRIRFFEVPMSEVFKSSNQNNADIGYAVTATHSYMHFGIGIYGWDQEVLKDVLANMTFVNTTDPAVA